MQGNQHMGQMGRAMLPPTGPPNMANHIPGNQQQAHSPNYPQQIGRPSSRPTTPGQGGIPHPSPSMANRLPPPSMNEINSELMRIPNTLLPKIKQESMIPQDKDLGAMTADEKVCPRVLQFVYLFTVLFSTACSNSSAQSIAISPSKGKDLPSNSNNSLILLVLPRHL